MSEHKVFKSY